MMTDETLTEAGKESYQAAKKQAVLTAVTDTIAEEAGQHLVEHTAKVGGKTVVKAGTKAASKVSTKVGSNAVAKTAATVAVKAGAKKAGVTAAKTALKKVPVVSVVAGTAFAIQRAAKGDWTGAVGEFASGAAACIPGAGTAVSCALDAALLAKDVYTAVDETKKSMPNQETYVQEYVQNMKESGKRLQEPISPNQTAQQNIFCGQDSVFNYAENATSSQEKLEQVRNMLQEKRGLSSPQNPPVQKPLIAQNNTLSPLDIARMQNSHSL